MSCSEPTHDNTARNTGTSKSEGRMKESYASRTKKKRRILKKILNKY